MTMRVFAIVVTYNGMRWIDSCLTSLRLSSSPLSIVIIDNGSSDGTPEYIKQQYPETVVVCLDKNLGFGQANNMGIRQALDADAGYVFLLNQDARVEPDTIGSLVDVQKENLDFGILSPLHLNGTGDRLDGGFQNYASPEYTPALLNDLLLHKFAGIYETKFVNAAAWLLSRKCIEKVGGFDPLFFHYGEDFNYCQRLQYHGFKIGIVPTAKIYHDRVYKKEAYGPEQIYRHFLLKVADVNNRNYLKNYKLLRQQDRVRMFTSIFRADMNRYIQNRKNIRRKKKSMTGVLKSRSMNMEGGLLYL